jgi:hypothetical protein
MHFGFSSGLQRQMTQVPDTQGMQHRASSMRHPAPAKLALLIRLDVAYAEEVITDRKLLDS